MKGKTPKQLRIIVVDEPGPSEAPAANPRSVPRRGQHQPADGHGPTAHDLLPADCWEVVLKAGPTVSKPKQSARPARRKRVAVAPDSEASANGFAQILTEVARANGTSQSTAIAHEAKACPPTGQANPAEPSFHAKENGAGTSDHLFRTLFEFASIGIAVHGADGHYLYTNRTYQRMVGYTNTELLELGARRITHPEDVDEGRRLFQELREGARDHYQREKRYIHRDGPVVWAHSVASAIRNTPGELQYVISMVEDITQRKRDEELAAAFGNLGHRLSAAATPREAATIIGDLAATLFGWDAFYLHLFGPDRKIVPVLTIDTIDGKKQEVPGDGFTLEPSAMMLSVAANGAQLINRNGTDDTTIPKLIRFGDVNRTSASILYAPIRNGGSQTVGILSIQSYMAHTYDEDDLCSLQALADHCAGALGRINAVEELRQSESRLRALLDGIPDLMLRLRRDGTVIDCKINDSDPASKLFQHCIGRKLHELWPARLVQGILLHVSRALQNDTTQIFDFEYPTGRQGRDYEVRVVRSGPDEALVIVRDFSERKQLEKEVLAISAREQARIGKDLHDGLGQLLTGMAFLARALHEKLSARACDEAEDAGHLAQLALKATTQTRLMARGLFPAELETKGLAAALKELAHSLEKLHKISCTLDVEIAASFSRKTVQKHLYRIVQEAANNAVKHARCAHVSISICRHDDWACLTVRDDGVGLNQGAPSPDGMGIRIMRYRARRIGGQVNIHQRETCGTEVQVQFPV